MATDKSAPDAGDGGVSDVSEADETAGDNTASNAGVSDLSYEQAREELIDIVAKIESGTVPLEESMVLWERGEALAAHCQSKLDAAQAQLDSSTPEAHDN